MTIYEMVKYSIEAKMKRGVLTEKYISDTQKKLDVFLMNDRVSQEEYNELMGMLKGE